ncbi:RNA methyltransferase [Candidatus Falkowbacteria bacterium]|uniref:Uncharacterized protein n=1 Tax=Candidatus Buchananbacteria bacterium CG10_big_fil_rev_8_21_14_0_10_33_19 TaxID=1974525 RepID=A0A2H0W3V4_9BACT|nr:RNA methyltransferase [Candidatus Falkowbacteria bacterium]PIS05984.1 MAG: hypothetical protein COT80_04425 [Candidatus Buchananbacteria bacterium CG10_big_fil_rev_8_21_14_0_10_33_19]
MIISSDDNAKIKHLKKLQLKKYREEFGEFLVENLVIIQDALAAGYKPISLFVSDEFLIKNREVVTAIANQSNLSDWFEINLKINKSFSNLDHPAGICAVYKKPTLKPISYDQSILYLNSIGDPGNLGTIFRSAVAFGFKDIILDETCVDVYNFKTIAAAKDTIFKININYDKNFTLLNKMKGQLPIVSTIMNKADNINDLNKLKNFCLVLGDESRGVDKNIEKIADKFIKINISPDIESLNVASAAAIILHSVYNK